jgi:type I restriction enzyme M protein
MEFKEEEGFCRAVTLEEIKKNDYNLNQTLYVFPIEKIEEIDIGKEWEELGGIENNLKEIDDKINGYLKELKYFGG